MKQTATLTKPDVLCTPPVKRLLIRVIISLTSEKFRTFVGVAAALWCWWGVCLGDNHVIGHGALLGLMGYLPYSWRQNRRDTKKLRSGKLF